MEKIFHSISISKQKSDLWSAELCSVSSTVAIFLLDFHTPLATLIFKICNFFPLLIFIDCYFNIFAVHEAITTYRRVVYDLFRKVSMGYTMRKRNMMQVVRSLARRQFGQNRESSKRIEGKFTLFFNVLMNIFLYIHKINNNLCGLNEPFLPSCDTRNQTLGILNKIGNEHDHVIWNK